LAQVAELTATLTAAQRHREVLGLGDVKLIAMLGAFLGADSCLYITLLSTLGALGLAGVLALGRGRRLAALPYAPFLAAAAGVWFFWGNRLVSWYGSVIFHLYWGQPA
jgi:leader peptidase (prepilin peptidase)/N-methyltransferase